MVTAKQIEAALRSVGGLGGQMWSMQQIADGANVALAKSGITTRQGAAVFIAQCMVESAYFRALSEYGGSKASYAPYYGRGLIQVTFKDNYAKFGAWAKSKGLVSDANYFVNNPNKLADEKWAWETAVWYLSTHRHDLIKLANEGKIDEVGKGVHAGDAYASWYPNPKQSFQAQRMDHTRKAYHALLAAGITAPNASNTTKKEDWFDMASKADLDKAVEESWAKPTSVWNEKKPRTRNQLLSFSYSRSGQAARDSAAALAIVRSLAKAQGMTDEQLDDIERKIDALSKD